MVKSFVLSLTTLLALWSAVATAENATRAHGYAIHHNAFLTSDLSPDMASRYNIRRSPHRGMVNISVIKEKPGTTGRSVRAIVKVTAHNLRGQVRPIPLREVKDGDAIYYLGEFLVENGEVDTFDVEVTPEGTRDTIKARFEQQFFTR